VSYFSAKFSIYAYQQCCEYKNLLHTYTILVPINTTIRNLIYTNNELLKVLVNHLSIFRDVKYRGQKHESINEIIKVSGPTDTSKFNFILLIYLTLVMYIPEDGHMIRRNMFFVYIN